MGLFEEARQIVREQAKNGLYKLASERSLGAVMHGDIIELKQDDFHFIVNNRRISLQISMRVLSDGVLATTFVSPRVIKTKNRARFVSFANELNTQVGTVAGRFYVEDLDLAYQVYCPESLLKAAPQEARKSLLEEGVLILSSVSLPIYGMAKKDWSAEKANRYVNQLYEDGIVYDGDYLD